jgi:transcriptional regulator with XRE-family HTH domain
VKTPHTPEYQLLIDLLVSGRKDAGITQQSLAQLLGKPQSFVAKVESRERRIDVIEFLTITRLIGVDPCILIRAVAAVMANQTGHPSDDTAEKE